MSKWYEQSVFYHIYPLGMTGAPKKNSPEERGNRFDELNRWIPHMKALNCNAVYIGPLFEASTHGYDTKDFRLVDSRLGSNEDFRQFIACCHENNIKVVVDGVFNHTGREFFAFKDLQEKGQDSPYKDWYKGVNFGWGSPLGDPFSYETWRGIGDLPCLNLFNHEVKQYLLETVRFWINEFDIDGIRLDCANVLDFGFMKELRALSNTIKPDFWLMGEVIHGEYSRWVNGDMLHSVTNYEMHKSIYSAHNDHNYFELAHNVRRLQAVGASLYTFVDNHDEDRIASKLLAREHLFPVYTLLFTLPGIPSVYYGSEWGIEGKRSSTSDEALRPCISITEMDEITQKPSQAQELSAHIQKLGAIRQEEEALHGGSYQELLLTNCQYAFARHSKNSTIITAANNDDKPASLSIPFSHPDCEALELLTGKSYPVADGRLIIELKGNDAVVFRIMEG